MNHTHKNYQQKKRQDASFGYRTLGYLLLCILCIMGIQQNANAFHIVGGEMTYTCNGGADYTVTLTVYRDCNCVDCAFFDDPAYLFVFENDGDLVDKREIAFPGAENVAPPTDICLETLPDVCVEKAVYIDNVSLPNNGIGYTLVYQRYSRNSSIINIWDPQETGSSYIAEVPPVDLAVCNNSPTFNSFPPIVICGNAPLAIDQSATDMDGDSLVYELCSPLIGGSETCPQPGNADNPGCSEITNPPPYNIVSWKSSYSGEFPLGGSPPVSIDPITGYLYGTPTELGQYVVGICVSEYRNGELINTLRRDFQFNVADCQVVLAAVESDSVTAAGDYVITDCGEDFTVDFVNISSGAVYYDWDFGDPTSTSDFSILTSPQYEYPDSGTYYVTLVADSGLGDCADTATIIVNVYPTLSNDFSYVADCANDPVTFTDLSQSTYGEIDSWRWDFGDGNTSSEQNPIHIYGQGGDQTVSLSTTTTLGCALTTSADIWVNPVPAASFEASILCPGVPVEFNNTTTISGAELTSWEWNFGDPNASPENNMSNDWSTSHTYEPGNYTVVLDVYTDDGCWEDKSFSFTIYSDFTADAGGDLEICEGDSIQLNAFNEFDWFNYEWSPADDLNDSTAILRNPFVSPTETTVYTVTISDPNGCIDVDDMTVVVHAKPAIELTPNTTICYQDSITLLASVPSNVVNMEWSSEGQIIGTELTMLVAPDSLTTYAFTAIDDRGCEKTEMVVISVDYPVMANADGSFEFCEGNSVALFASGGGSYRWTPTTGLSDPNIANPIATPTVTTDYVVEVYNSCFNDFDTISVIVHPLPAVDAGPDITINIGETGLLNGDATGTLQWTPETGLSDPTIAMPDASPLDSTLYFLSTTDEFGCQNTDSVWVQVTRIFNVIIPTGFSPNNDGVNDAFRIIASQGLKDLRIFKVYNRWGQMVFEGNDFDSEWDGTYRGVPLDVGVYVYYVAATNFLEEPFLQKGNITLVR